MACSDASLTPLDDKHLLELVGNCFRAQGKMQATRDQSSFLRQYGFAFCRFRRDNLLAHRTDGICINSSSSSESSPTQSFEMNAAY